MAAIGRMEKARVVLHYEIARGKNKGIEFQKYLQEEGSPLVRAFILAFLVTSETHPSSVSIPILKIHECGRAKQKKLDLQMEM